jgi:hypothetical protein
MGRCLWGGWLRALRHAAGADIEDASVEVFHEHDIRFVEIVLHVYERMAVGS